jgi:prepilin signal peptidase PulO-like enzyme (type II secretory pathway)
LRDIDWIDFSLLLIFLVPIVIWDIKVKRIPDIFVLPGIVFFFVKRAIEREMPVYTILLTGCAGFTFISLLFVFSKGKIGLGDAKLSTLISVVWGLKLWIVALFIASFTGTIFALILIAFRKMKWKTRLPFAPFFSFGSLVPFFLQDLSFIQFFHIEKFVSSLFTMI